MRQLIKDTKWFWTESFSYMNYRNETISGKLRFWKQFPFALFRFLKASRSDSLDWYKESKYPVIEADSE